MIAFKAKVLKVEEKFRQKCKSGVGKEAVMEDVSLGWFMHLQGSFESLHVGETKPAIEPGEYVLVTIRKQVRAD